MNTMSRCIRSSLLLALTMACAMPAMAQDARKVNPAQLYNYWILLNTKVQVDLPMSGANLLKPGCVAVSYIIGSDGVPRNVKIQKTEPQSGLGPAAVSAVSNFRYGPSLTNHNSDPVSTYYVVPFNAPDDKAQRQQIMDACKLPGYDQA
ncbi:MAG: energy transducer TonB [Rhodanobacter sp.]